MDAITYSTARAHLASTMDRVCEDHEPLIITRNSEQSVVMLSLEDFNALQETAYLLRPPQRAAPALGHEAFERGVRSGTPADRRMKPVFDDEAWEDYLHWQKQDRKMVERIYKLIKEVMREPFAGAANQSHSNTRSQASGPAASTTSTSWSTGWKATSCRSCSCGCTIELSSTFLRIAGLGIQVT